MGNKSSVIRQEGESQNEGNKKGKHAKFFEKRTFLFRKIWRVLLSCYLRFEIRTFALPYYRRIVANLSNLDDCTVPGYVSKHVPWKLNL